MREFWASLASLMGVLAFCQGLLTTIFPPELRFSLLKLLNRISNYFSSYCYFDITEIDGVNTNELYNAVQLYLSTSSAVSHVSGRLSLTRSVNSSGFTFGLAHNDTLFDTFNGVTIQWEHTVTQRPPSQSFSWRPVPDEKRGFTLRVKKTQKSTILGSYLDHIMDRADEIRRKNMDRYLYTNTRGGSLDSTRPGHPWEAVPFKHPSTFETLAMDPEKRTQILEDLTQFANGESFYRVTGRAWKRGYLLFGPPGTGKSSLIAAMANHLGYDIYDLELTEVGSNSELRKLLMKTTPKSIIVIEDIDCSVNLNRVGGGKGPNRIGSGRIDPEEGSGSVTLSGLLGFTDGLWSCCGSERIFVFTTNHVEKLDPALLRSGRMDMHVHMGYCSFEGLKVLVRNYLGFEVGEFGEEMVAALERVVEAAEITPADLSEVLIRKRQRAVAEVAAEVVSELKRRVAMKGGDRKLVNGNNSDEEEQEKRELLEMINVNHGTNENGLEANLVDCSKQSQVDDDDDDKLN